MIEWFLVAWISAGHNQGDLWIPNLTQYHASIKVPSQEICEQISSMNYGVECHGVVKKEPK